MVRIAGVQFGGHIDKEVNVATAVRLVRQAARGGAQIICLPELFSTMYFCVETRQEYFEWAETIPGPTIERMAELARETATVLICYDRHFPEAARILGLGGADIVFVPTVTSGMTRHLWDLELRAHAVTNIYYVCGVNKVGVDVGGSTRHHFGSSLVASPRGEIIAQANDTGEDMAVADIDVAVIPELRAMWGYYRDRRPDLYGPLAEMPGRARDLSLSTVDRRTS